jgi:hypothetical protein
MVANGRRPGVDLLARVGADPAISYDKFSPNCPAHCSPNAIGSHGGPVEVTTDRAHTLVRVVADLLPAALHDTTQYANNRVEADHGRPKARLRPMRGLKRDRIASVVIRGHAFIQNLRRVHYELGVDARPGLTLAAAFDELAQMI